MNKKYGSISCLSICQIWLSKSIKMCQNLLLKPSFSVEQSNSAGLKGGGCKKSYYRNRHWCEWMNESESERVEENIWETKKTERVSWLAEKQQPSAGLQHTRSANSVRKSLKGRLTHRAWSDGRVCSTVYDCLHHIPASPEWCPPFSQKQLKRFDL